MFNHVNHLAGGNHLRAYLDQPSDQSHQSHPPAGQSPLNPWEGLLSSPPDFGARALSSPHPTSSWPSVHFVTPGKGCFSLTKNNKCLPCCVSLNTRLKRPLCPPLFLCNHMVWRLSPSAASGPRGRLNLWFREPCFLLHLWPHLLSGVQFIIGTLVSGPLIPSHFSYFPLLPMFWKIFFLLHYTGDRKGVIFVEYPEYTTCVIYLDSYHPHSTLQTLLKPY